MLFKIPGLVPLAMMVGTPPRATFWAALTFAAIPPVPKKPGKEGAPKTPSRRSSSARGKGSLYHFTPDGKPTKLLEEPKDYFVSLALGGDGRPYVGTGAEGRVYTVDDAHNSVLVADTDERQVTALVVGAKTGYVACSDPPVLHPIRGVGGPDAIWTSKVLDAGQRAQFGTMRWVASGALEFSTRSGNTSTPDETWSDWSPPQVTAGVVASPDSELSGQRVAVDPAVPCNVCEFCREGNHNLCSDLHFAGHGMDDGALREYMVWSERCLHPLPDAISDVEWAMLEPLGVALHAVDLGKVQPDSSVGVFGCGPIGLLVLQLTRLAGAEKIIVTDRLPHRLDAALSMGATKTILVTNDWDVGEIWEATGGRGVEVAFEVATENLAVETAITAVRPGGRVILIGIPAENQTCFTASTARRKGLVIKLSRRMKFTYPRAIQLVESGSIDVGSLVTHRYPLTDYQQAFQVARMREGLKVVIQP